MRWLVRPEVFRSRSELRVIDSGAFAPTIARAAKTSKEIGERRHRSRFYRCALRP